MYVAAEIFFPKNAPGSFLFLEGEGSSSGKDSGRLIGNENFEAERRKEFITKSILA